jgi:phenylalanyl-tRNA synthetase beta chain
MKVSYNWLQNHIEEELPKPKDLAEKIIFHAFEVEEVEEKGDDTIMDIKVLPDRAHDCLSHIGIAREVAGLLNLTLKKEVLDKPDLTKLEILVEVKSDQCRRYSLASMKNVKVSESPKWLKDAIESIGQKSINSLVDIANYLMFDTGQPIHIFDADKIDGGITVRPAHEDETIITLTGESKTLNPNILVIADYVGAVAIAGIKGGKTAEVDDKTKNILIEVGNFDPVSTRKSARTLSLQTDASKRYENDFSPEHTIDVIYKTIKMIEGIAGGEAIGISDYYPNPQKERVIDFSIKSITRLLGSWVTGEQIKEVFDRYNYNYELNADNLKLVVPTDRLDITGAHDIAEEIGRVIGYEKVPEKLVSIDKKSEESEVYKKIISVKSNLTKNGFKETMTYSFQKKGDIEVSYGAKDKSALRTNISESLKRSYEQNRLNAPLLGMEKIKMFEIGSVFKLDGKEIKEEINVATVDNGTIQELSLDDFIKQNNISDENLEIHSEVIPFKMWSLYPFITRDIAVWVNNDAKNKLDEIVDDFASHNCIVPAKLFDQFTKDGRTSVAYRFVFQSYDRTLTDDEVQKSFDTLLKEIKSHKDFEIR